MFKYLNSVNIFCWRFVGTAKKRVSKVDAMLNLKTKKLKNRRAGKNSAHKKTKSAQVSKDKKKFGLGLVSGGRKSHPRPAKRISAHKIKIKKMPTKAEINKKIDLQKNRKAYEVAAKAVISSMVADQQFKEYVERVVENDRTVDIISKLNKPRSDEDIAKMLDMKINAVRTVLNKLQGMGITNYSVSNNKKGWLSFSWELDAKKATDFVGLIENKKLGTDVVTEQCNDYFICEKCYKENKLILTFDAAYESSFRCVCDKRLSQLSKAEVARILPETKT